MSANVQQSRFMADWRPNWAGGVVEVFDEFGNFIQMLPISQVEAERLISANPALGTQWVVDHCKKVIHGDVVTHHGSPPWLDRI